ncbi:MAG TPA: toll/interleukin-1 receptor domain-containing protein [Verrucomicrobiales bacterium]|nr:toll/interleukin-1 receptor domain-containing protein [Verrucomicrobiales bacterium]
MNLEEKHWEQLLTDIHGRQVIPVVGPELMILEIDGKPVTLYRHLAKLLVERLELDPKDLVPEYGFYHVVSEFLAQQPTHPKRHDREDIYYMIRGIMDSQSWPTPEPLKQLAAITDFDLFVTTTFDMLMEQALNEGRHDGRSRCRSYAYCKREKLVDLPDDFQPAECPTVFHFFGKLNPMNDFAVTDEDILQYAHRFLSRDFRPHNLFDQFRDKRLLTLGCSFPGWLTRFFLVAAKGDELFTVGVPGVLADDLSIHDRELVGFLNRKKINVYSQGDAANFVSELHRRWMEKFGAKADETDTPTIGEDGLPSDMAPESVFISFRSDDRDIARSIARRFRDAGIDVWFDETDLEAGDRYKEKIASHIDRCFMFVPLISRHSLTCDSQPWFYRFEWKRAIKAAEFRFDSFKFILPVLVDDASPKCDAIPAEFRELHITRLENLDAIVADTKERIRDQRRERRTG